MKSKQFCLRPVSAGNLMTPAKVFSFHLKKPVTAAMTKSDVLNSIRTAMMNYQDFGGLDERDFLLVSPAPAGQVLTKPLIILMYTKTPEQMANFFALTRFLESSELSSHLKFKVKFLTHKSDISSIKIFTGVDTFAELIGVGWEVEESSASTKESVEEKIKTVMDKHNKFAVWSWDGDKIIVKVGEANFKDKGLVDDLSGISVEGFTIDIRAK